MHCCDRGGGQISVYYGFILITNESPLQELFNILNMRFKPLKKAVLKNLNLQLISSAFCGRLLNTSMLY